MDGVLHVLQRPSPQAARLHQQRITFAEPPRRGRRFECWDVNGGLFRTAAVEMEPRRVSDDSVWFNTAHTAYLLEQLPAGPPPERA